MKGWRTDQPDDPEVLQYGMRRRQASGCNAGVVESSNRSSTFGNTVVLTSCFGSPTGPEGHQLGVRFS